MKKRKQMGSSKGLVILNAETQIKYPQLVKSNKFALRQKLKARIDRTNVGNGLSLSYCKTHKQYYLDINHTNNVIRCPICEKRWLLEHDFYSIRK